MENKQYIQNPDVVLREEEDEVGGLLFNPDTNQIHVLNTTGLFIWKACDGSRGVPEIVDYLKESFDEVPEEEVIPQVEGFIEQMVATSFIGTVEA
jgi:hypothetical protein